MEIHLIGFFVFNYYYPFIFPIIINQVNIFHPNYHNLPV